jgi:hypothetical protein
MLSIASELAEGVLLYLRPQDELRRTVANLRSSTHSSKNFEIVCSFICAVSNKDPQKARERAAKTLAFYIAVGKYYAKFLSENGFKNDIEQIIFEYNKNGRDAAVKVVSDKMLESLTICGSTKDCEKLLAKFRSTGITLPILQLNPVDDTESSFRELFLTFSSA